tara:strand:+ start:13282 stop:13719 length:438 start_codon:yes stop_codon:yes gene_type:complete
MTKKVLQKNVDPSVAAYVGAVESDMLSSIKQLKELILETGKQVSELRKELLTVQKSSDSTDSSIAAVELKAKRLIDKAFVSRNHEDESWKEEIEETTVALVSRVVAFEKRMDSMEGKLTRYFDKEKYAITKAMIAKVISEEKANG